MPGPEEFAECGPCICKEDHFFAWTSLEDYQALLRADSLQEQREASGLDRRKTACDLIAWEAFCADLIDA